MCVCERERERDREREREILLRLEGFFFSLSRREGNLCNVVNVLHFLEV